MNIKDKIAVIGGLAIIALFPIIAIVIWVDADWTIKLLLTDLILILGCMIIHEV